MKTKFYSELHSCGKGHLFGIALICISDLHSFGIRNCAHLKIIANALRQADTTNY